VSPDVRSTAFKAEALPHWRDVYRFAWSLCEDDAEADDVVQETFLRAYRSWHTYRPGTDCRKWLFTICRHAFLRGRERRRTDCAGIADVEAGPHHDAAATAELRGAVARALDAVPEPYRSAILLVDVESCAYGDASERLGVPIGTIRSRVHRARKLLRPPLAPFAEDLGLRVAGGRR